MSQILHHEQLHSLVTHFSFGLTSAFTSIIFIHGLNGDREKTWTAKGATKPWPQILLPTKLPKARILTYGYDASVVGWKDWKGVVSENRIGDHAMNLLATISNYRDEDGLVYFSGNMFANVKLIVTE